MKCSIDSNTREIIFLDNSECFGVEFDKNTQRIEFSCPKIVGDNLDLTKCTCRINYMNAKGFRDSYLIDDILVDGDNITFTWALKSKVTAGRGICLFIFCARQLNENGVIEKEWNTTVAKASIKRGLETNSHIEEEYSDILESILLKINSVSLTTEVNAESSNENVPTAKAVYDALQDIGTPSGTDISLNVTGATVGQTIKVKTVDANGKPTAWEAVNMAAGDTWELLGTLDASSAEVLQLDFPYPVKKLYFSSVLTDSAGEAYTESKTVYRQVAFNVDGTWKDVNGFKIGCSKYPYGWRTRYWLECGADLPTAKGEWASTLSSGSAQLQLTPFHTVNNYNYTKGPISGIRFSLTLSAAAENAASGSIEVWGVKA